MRIFFFTFLLTFVFQSSAHASYFEFCKLDGVVTKDTKVNSKGLWFRLKVKESTPAECGQTKSEAPEICRNYVGRSIKVGLPKDTTNTFRSGNRVTIIQRAWDVTAGEHQGTVVQWQLPGTCK